MDILILAIIAGAVLWRLIRTFGQMSDNVSKTLTAEYAILDERSEHVQHIQKQYEQEQLMKLESSLPARALEVLRVAEMRLKGFNITIFLDGARKAYEMLMLAIANADMETIKHLVTPELQANYKKALEDLKRQRYTQDLLFIGINKSEVRKGELSGNTKDGTISFTVYFESEVVNAILDKSGAVVEGNAKKIYVCKHNLTFVKELDSKDSMWLITESDI
ncbi:MAG: Tim44/TimA family putative adaptor protein [Proteobacteria bacterium]|nr:Tim44/TimA family putative adaptor protein [Pseudomonadota bacterium]